MDRVPRGGLWTWCPCFVYVPKFARIQEQLFNQFPESTFTLNNLSFTTARISHFPQISGLSV